MAESSKRKFGDIRTDRISILPRDIQEIILCFLPIRDAVRTSILSRNWRHCWTTIPHLFFDRQFLHNTNKFVSAINEVLLLHNGPILGLTHLRLTLENYSSRVITANDFSFLGLTHLRLTCVQFPSTPTYGEFTYLTSLELETAVDFGQSIFNCPVLGKLRLIRCRGLSLANFQAPHLICIYEVSEQITLVGLKNIREYSFNLINYSKLEQLRVTSNLVKILGSLQKIEKFSIGSSFIKYLAEGVCPDRLSKPMPYLKSLTIFNINFVKLSEISCLLCLMRSAPNLCKLHIKARFTEDAAEVNLKDYLVEDCTKGHLEIVTFNFLNGFRAELELVKFILAHSPLLKTMFIPRVGVIKKDVALRIKEEILQYLKLRQECKSDTWNTMFIFNVLEV